MKALGGIIQSDTSVLSNEGVLETIKMRFRDKSSAVREASVDVIGKYAITDPELISTYYQHFRDRINDSGLSVRKRVIKIFREICLGNPNHPRYIDICVQLLRHVNETNDGVRRLVTQTFEDIWFTDGPVMRNRAKMTKEQRKEANSNFTEDFRDLVQQIVDVIGKLLESGAENAISAVVDLITQLLTTEGKKKKKSDQAYLAFLRL